MDSEFIIEAAPLPTMPGGIKAGIVVSLLPLIFSILVVTTVTVKRGRKQEDREDLCTRRQETPSFQPKVLSWQALSMLLGASLSAMALLELSCHALPAVTTDNRDVIAGNFIGSSAKLIPGQGGLTAGLVGSTPQAADPCRYLAAGTPCDRPKEDSTTTSKFVPPMSEPSHDATGSVENSTGSTSAASSTPASSAYSDSAEATPPSTLYMTQTEIDSAYFTASVLPTLLAILLLIPFKAIYVHLSSLDLFHRLAQTGGASGRDSILTTHLGFRSMFLPVLNAFDRRFVVFAGAVLQWLAALAAPLASECSRIVLVGTCEGRADSSGCVPVVAVNKTVARVLLAIMAMISATIIGLLWLLRSWESGVVADPRSIASIATLCLGDDIRNELHTVPTNGIYTRSAVFGKLEAKYFALASVSDGIGICRTAPARPPPGKKYSALLITLGDVLSRALRPLRRWKADRADYDAVRVRFFAVILTLIAFSSLLTGLNILMIYYRYTKQDTAFERFMSGQGFGVNFLFTLFGIVIGFAWMSLFEVFLLVAPFMNLSTPQPAESTILKTYVADPYSATVDSVRSRHLPTGILSIVTILSDFLPLTLSNIPFNRTQTFSSFEWCSALSIGILSIMAAVSTGLAIQAWRRLPRGPGRDALDLGLLKKCPVAGTMIVVTGSHDFLRSIAGLSKMETQKRNQTIASMGLKFRIETAEQSRRAIIKISNSALGQDGLSSVLKTV